MITVCKREKEREVQVQYKNAILNLLFSAVMILLSIIVSGCSSVPNKASTQQDHQAKLFKTHPQKSNLYIYRGIAQGASIEMEIMVDGRSVATSVGKTYIKLTVAPGKHRIVSRADNSDKLILATVKNHNYFILQGVEVGGVEARTKLTLMSESAGKSGVKQCQLISLLPQPAQFSMLQN